MKAAGASIPRTFKPFAHRAHLLYAGHVNGETSKEDRK